MVISISDKDYKEFKKYILKDCKKYKITDDYNSSLDNIIEKLLIYNPTLAKDNKLKNYDFLRIYHNNWKNFLYGGKLNSWLKNSDNLLGFNTFDSFSFFGFYINCRNSEFIDFGNGYCKNNSKPYFSVFAILYLEEISDKKVLRLYIPKKGNNLKVKNNEIELIEYEEGNFYSSFDLLRISIVNKFIFNDIEEQFKEDIEEFFYLIEEISKDNIILQQCKNIKEKYDKFLE